MKVGLDLHVELAGLVLAELVVLLEDLAQAHRIDLGIAPAPLRLGYQAIHLHGQANQLSASC